MKGCYRTFSSSAAVDGVVVANPTTTLQTTAERREDIVRLIRQARHVRVEELADRFHVSTVTIRSDLNYLNDKGLIIRSRGGAAIADVFVQRLPLQDKAGANTGKKQIIGKAAANLINNGDSIILDSGTTNQQIARYLQEKQNLVVMTNDLNVANELADIPDISLMMTGGTLQQASRSFYGQQAEESLQNFHFNKLFLSVDSFDLKAGLTSYFDREASLNRTMCRVASEIILVTDSSKFGKKSCHLILPFARFHTLVTDSDIPDQYLCNLQEQGIRVIIADEQL